MVPKMTQKASKLKRAAQMTLEEASTFFPVHGRAEGESPKTVEWYREVLGRLQRWLETEDRSTRLHDIDEMTLLRN